MLEKTERTIKNGQSRETVNIGHKLQNGAKQNKSTAQKTKTMSNTDLTEKKPGMNPGTSERSSVPSQSYEF